MSWYKIENKVDRAEIWIYEAIGEDFWSGGGVTAKKFQEEISAIKAKQIDVHINSPGGSVFDGVTIYNLLKQHEAKITSYIDGLAASIASVIALAGDQIIMAENALFMIHNPSGFVMGTSTDMRKMADVLDKIRSTMSGVYSGKSGKPEDEINGLMDNETWMTASEAKEAGFIDDIAEEMDMAACAKFIPVMAKAGFKRIPNEIRASIEVPTAKDAEKSLRDAGFSRKQAKAILAEGFKGCQRDVDPPAALRDVAPAEHAKKDRIADLLVRAEIIAPSNQDERKES
jgi:ATP-dependent Clp endopeptidase proteolytic subunit ClpP